jgi:predicted nuclease of predicted toxin-antitoxin system
MKILLNQHLSWKLVDRLAPYFEEVRHVRDLNYTEADDHMIISWARENGFGIVTKDSDYNDLVVSSGPPPIIIWLRTGNCSTALIESILVRNVSRIVIEAQNSASGIISIL